MIDLNEHQDILNKISTAAVGIISDESNDANKAFGLDGEVDPETVVEHAMGAFYLINILKYELWFDEKNIKKLKNENAELTNRIAELESQINNQ